MKKFKSLLSIFSTNTKEEKKPHSVFAHEEGHMMDGNIRQCVSLPQSICEYLRVSFVV